jgi:hypothetical protein
LPPSDKEARHGLQVGSKTVDEDIYGMQRALRHVDNGSTAKEAPKEGRLVADCR